MEEYVLIGKEQTFNMHEENNQQFIINDIL